MRLQMPPYANSLDLIYTGVILAKKASARMRAQDSRACFLKAREFQSVREDIYIYIYIYIKVDILITTLRYYTLLVTAASSFLQICVFVLGNMRLRFFFVAFLCVFCVLVFCVLLRFYFLRFRFSFGVFLCSRVNGCRSKCISCSSLSYNMTPLFIKNQNNVLNTYFRR